jgi:pimeloyl-ACP methyl ester carboxylesterase
MVGLRKRARREAELLNITVNGISMAYERSGTGAPLLLVHGFPLDHRTWLPLVPYLEDSFDVIMPDLRGFGHSDAPEGAYQMNKLATDLAALLDGLNIQNTYIAGHSMGGYVSLEFARAAPSRVLGLGMISSQVAADPPDRKAGRYSTAEQVMLKGTSVVAGMADKLSANLELAPFFRDLILEQSPQGVIGALIAMAERPDSGALFSSFHFPVVIVHGLVDALIPPERSHQMKALLPPAKLFELPGIGHTPAMEIPYETGLRIKNLLTAA